MWPQLMLCSVLHNFAYHRTFKKIKLADSDVVRAPYDSGLHSKFIKQRVQIFLISL